MNVLEKVNNFEFFVVDPSENLSCEIYHNFMSAKLKEVFSTLNENGFSFVNGRRINFWSGQKAKQKAWNDKSLNDGKIPAIAVAFDICREIQKIERLKNRCLLARFFPKIISAIYSSEAKDQVEVFISNDKCSEKAS